MLKKFMFSLLVIMIICPFASADDRDDLDKLRREKADIDLKMYEKRVELIQKDAELKALHEKIMAYHKELAMRLDKHPEMTDFVRKAKRISAEINGLEEKLGISKDDEKDSKPAETVKP